MQSDQALEVDLATVNGVVITRPDEVLDTDTLHQRAYSELLRQTAIQTGLLAASDTPAADGVLSEAASHAIETLLAQEVRVAQPSEEACRRHHAAHQASYTTGERVEVRHILFAVTPGVDLNALRQQAEATLLNVRCHDGKNTEDVFAKQARHVSNCPSGSEGGQLGWLSTSDCAPEFAKELFGHKEIGVLPRLVHSRFGLHVVEILGRQPGVAQPFESVQGTVSMALQQQSFVTALRQYLSLLAADAQIQGIELERADSALVQ
ncbi:MAG: peptidyl-prolyl cis-trans isomerase C [Comamonadaceae bacterium]|nr:MAG: peptidyl-prolyl cis-trans isomerase C [Comamonadaceae bacterium]